MNIRSDHATTFSSILVGESFKLADNGKCYLRIPRVQGMLTDLEYEAISLDETVLEAAITHIDRDEIVFPLSALALNMSE